jgi:DNA ligase D-like protein (predicted 3'-phosphoesterase)
MNQGRFVIHKHETEKSHYDLRVEIDGFLHSWALTKGISTDSAVRRMGIKIEDLPLDKLKYEGELTEERYGTGPVIVWDYGTYTNLRMDNGDDLDMKESLEDGHLKLFLEGKKLKGGYTLIDVPYGRTKWLQVKEADEYVDKANNIMERLPGSVLAE